MLNWPRLLAGEVGDPPRDSGTAVDVGHAREGDPELIQKQRKVRASENHGVDPIADGASNIGWTAALTSSTLTFSPDKLGLGELDEFGRAVADERAVCRESGRKIVDIRLANRGLGAEHADDPAFSTFRRRA